MSVLVEVLLNPFAQALPDRSVVVQVCSCPSVRFRRCCANTLGTRPSQPAWCTPTRTATPAVLRLACVTPLPSVTQGLPRGLCWRHGVCLNRLTSANRGAPLAICSPAHKAIQPPCRRSGRNGVFHLHGFHECRLRPAATVLPTLTANDNNFPGIGAAKLPPATASCEACAKGVHPCQHRLTCVGKHMAVLTVQIHMATP